MLQYDPDPFIPNKSFIYCIESFNHVFSHNSRKSNIMADENSAVMEASAGLFIMSTITGTWQARQCDERKDHIQVIAHTRPLLPTSANFTMRNRRDRKIIAVACFFIAGLRAVLAFSSPSGGNNEDPQLPTDISRRNLLYWPIGIGGAVVYGNVLSEAIAKLSRGDLVYPEAHEQRVRDVISKTTLASIPSDITRPLRLLEVGIGKECRLIRRGLYKNMFGELSTSAVSKVQFVGVDIERPSVGAREDAERCLKQTASSNGIALDLSFSQASITSPLDFPDGWFDAIICSLTLCSVGDQDAALVEIQRLLRPSGGTFGFVEHVAVNADEPYSLLALQQGIFDPLQQVVADNCHLHRATADNIDRTFEVEAATTRSSVLFQERFLVNGMWPVSCQACGVIQRKV